MAYRSAPTLARRFIAVSPSNTVPIPAGCIGLYVGGLGNVVCTGDDGNSVTFTAVPVGAWLMISPVLIQTASTATLMIAAYG